MKTGDSECRTGEKIADVLALERTREAAERTLMAWLRTCLSLMSFGFAPFKLIQVIPEEGAQKHPLTVLISMLFMLLGILAMVGAAAQHVVILRKLQLECDSYKPKRSLGLAVSAALMAIGGFAFTVVLIEFFVLKR